MSKATVIAIYTDFVDELEGAGYFISDINPKVYEDEVGSEVPESFIPLIEAAGGEYMIYAIPMEERHA